MKKMRPYITNGDSMLLTRLQCVPLAPLQDNRQEYLTIIAEHREYNERQQLAPFLDKLRPILGIAKKAGQTEIAEAILAVLKDDNRLSKPPCDPT